MTFWYAIAVCYSMYVSSSSSSSMLVVFCLLNITLDRDRVFTVFFNSFMINRVFTKFFELLRNISCNCNMKIMLILITVNIYQF